MADFMREETYRNVKLDLSDMTLTEFLLNETNTYSVLEILKRWENLPSIEITIRQLSQLPPLDGRQDI